MDDTLIIWAVLLIAAAILIFFIEIFVPTGGVLGVLAGLAMVSGIVILFYKDTTLGLIGTIVSLVALPFVMGLGLKILPNTPIFKRLTLTERQQATPPLVSDGAHASAVVVGDTGKALTELRPVGTVLINGQRVDCLAEQGIIQPGAPVRVVSVDGMQTKVRASEG